MNNNYKTAIIFFCLAGFLFVSGDFNYGLFSVNCSLFSIILKINQEQSFWELE